MGENLQSFRDFRHEMETHRRLLANLSSAPSPLDFEVEEDGGDGEEQEDEDIFFTPNLFGGDHSD
eukprot:gene15209-19422_t